MKDAVRTLKIATEKFIKEQFITHNNTKGKGNYEIRLFRRPQSRVRHYLAQNALSVDKLLGNGGLLLTYFQHCGRIQLL